MASTTSTKKTTAQKTFDELLDELMNSPSEKVRYNAARVLGEMGDPAAVEPLIDVLKNDKNGSVRLYAARALGELGDPRATLPLIESLQEDRNVDVRVRAARALGRLGGEEVVLPLVEALSDANSQVCMTAADALVEIGNIAVQPLIKSLKHEKVNVRCDATRSLGELGDKTAVEPLIDMLTDEWVNVRIYAVQSLGKLGDKRAVPNLISVFENQSENDLVRAGAAAALGALKDQRALLPLRNLIMQAEELGEIEDTALKAYKMIMAANWKNVPGATYNKKIVGQHQKQEA
jgi:HEAT repeat protein